MEVELRAKLLAMAALTALVDRRIDWGVRAQGEALPAVELHQVGRRRLMNLAGPGAWSTGRVQVDCWGRTFKAACDVADIIAAPVADGGLLGLRATLGNIRFRIFVLDRASGRETDSLGIVHRTRLDLNVWTAPIQGD